MSNSLVFFPESPYLYLVLPTNRQVGSVCVAYVYVCEHIYMLPACIPNSGAKINLFSQNSQRNSDLLIVVPEFWAYQTFKFQMIREVEVSNVVTTPERS